jgi:hypothetical protein
MRDFARLREHLRIALACAPLVAGACTKSGQQPKPTGPTTTDAAGKQQAKVAPPPDATASDIGPGPPDNLPTCPNGKWCGDGSGVKDLGSPGEATVKLGCTTPLESGDGTKDKVPKDFPNAGSQMPIEATLDEAATKAKRDAKDQKTCCYDWVSPCPGGRPLLEGGRAIVAEAVRPEVAPEDALARALGEAWLADALAEHASIASFARATIELMALGAPPELLTEVQRASLDEIRHAERCFALSARYLGGEVGPGALAAPAPRPTDLARLACDTFAEGCAGETVSLLVATRALAGCEDEDVKRVLAGIVRDETRHAALAWRTVRWAVAQGGAPVIAALRDTARTLRPEAAPACDADPILLAHGRLDPASQRAAAHDAWEHVILPTLADVITA